MSRGHGEESHMNSADETSEIMAKLTIGCDEIESEVSFIYLYRLGEFFSTDSSELCIYVCLSLFSYF